MNSDANTTPVATNAGDANPSRGGLALRISQGDIYDLARLVHGEARGESFEGKVAIVAVVLNRLESKKFGNSIKQVIFEPGAFTAIDDGQFYMEPDESSYEAVQAALRGWDPTGLSLIHI